MINIMISEYEMQVEAELDRLVAEYPGLDKRETRDKLLCVVDNGCDVVAGMRGTGTETPKPVKVERDDRLTVSLSNGGYITIGLRDFVRALSPWHVPLELFDGSLDFLEGGK